MIRVVIVTQGDPDNKDFDYSRQVVSVIQLLSGVNRNDGTDRYLITTAYYAEQAVSYLEKNGGGYVVFVSAYFCKEAIRLQEKHGSRVNFVVASCGLAPRNLPACERPVFLFRGEVTPETFRERIV